MVIGNMFRDGFLILVGEISFFYKKCYIEVKKNFMRGFFGRLNKNM